LGPHLQMGRKSKGFIEKKYQIKRKSPGHMVKKRAVSVRRQLFFF
jgi:hypothetical protein